MKKIAILGGIVIILIAVIKIGGMLADPSKETKKGQTTTEESSPAPPAEAPAGSRETITIEIENGGASDEATTAGFDPTETPAGLPEVKATTEAPKFSGTDPATAASYNVTPMDPKTMYAIKSVNVRKGCSTDTEVLGGLAPGGEVKATGESGNGWIRITYKGGDAYVYKTYLSSNKADVVIETTAVNKGTAAPKKTAAATGTTTAKATPPAATTPAGTPAEETIAPFPGN